MREPMIKRVFRLSRSNKSYHGNGGSSLFVNLKERKNEEKRKRNPTTSKQIIKKK